jgi:hypothetical protein
MGNCDAGSGCQAAKGCGLRKEDQARIISETIARLYPTRRFGEISDTARFRAGVPPPVARKVADRATESLSARTYLREGAPEDLCDYLWILCVGREPSLLELREKLAMPEAERIQESYLRVALSSLVRAATIQEVQLRLRRRDGAFELSETTLDGVYDPVLLPRMQKMVALLGEAGIAHLDFGMLQEDAPREPAIDFGDYAERYGAKPSALALLFYPCPPIMTTTAWLDPM